MPAIYHEGSWLGNATDPEVLVKDTVGWTGKNLAIPQEGYALDGNETDGYRIVITGTTSMCYIAKVESGKTYKISKTAGAGNRFRITGFKNYPNTSVESTARNVYVNANANKYTFTNTGDWAYIVFLVNYNAGFDYSTAHGMVCDADITDPTYEPYHESVEEEIEQIYADNGVLGAKNFLNPTYAGGTVNGVTITANENKTYELNGAPSSGNMAVAIYTGTFPVGRYILNGVPDFATYGARLHIRETAGASQVDAIDTGKGIEFTIPSATTSYSVFMYLNSGYTANNLIIKPMIRLASDPDDTYQPYAMTNRELTEKKINIADLKTVVSASSDFADFKTRIASL